MGEVQNIEYRRYGRTGPWVVLIHGGPGAPGYLAPIGRQLAEWFRVIEPFQRSSGGAELTVRRHLDDLHRLLDQVCGDDRPVLVGHSWGAMLALASAAQRPAQGAVLIGCGTFDADSRRLLEQRRRERMGPELQRELKRLERQSREPDASLEEIVQLLLPVDSVDPVTSDLELRRCDARGARESWADMIHRQSRGEYPAAFAGIEAPVLMLHGAEDPHPGPEIRRSLMPHLPQLEYRELADCGHYPWIERKARDRFFRTLVDWLVETTEVNLMD